MGKYDWTTRDGAKLDIRDMETSHIKNCIRMFEKVISTYPGEQVYMGDSEYGDEAVESENRINRERLERYQSKIRVFEEVLASKEQSLSNKGSE